MGYKQKYKSYDLPDNFDMDLLKRRAHEILARNEYLTITKLHMTLKDDGVSIKKHVLLKCLKSCGFKFGRPSKINRIVLCERKDIKEKRADYLRRIDEARREGRHIFYLDETWVDTNSTPTKQWMPPHVKDARKLPVSRGYRFVLLNCGSREGWLPGCDLVFQTINTDGRDYHSEMNAKIFENWMEKQLVPALPPNSAVVMDNASYHSVAVPGSRPPTSNSKKDVMVQWLREKNVTLPPKSTKKELYDIILKHKPQTTPRYRVDHHLFQNGHIIIRLPPYHCDLNPIELIWSQVKGFVARKNSTFKKKDVQHLINQAFKSVTSEAWRKACDHVLSIENMYRRQDNLQPRVTPVIIPIDSETDTAEEMEYN